MPVRVRTNVMGAMAAVTIAAAAAFGAFVGGGAQAGAATTAQWRSWYSSSASVFMTGVVAFGPKAIWSVGVPDNYSYRPFVVRWDGSSWRSVSIPGSAGYQTAAIGGSSTGNVWVFAGNKVGQKKAFRFDGAHWHTIAVPANSFGWASPVVLSKTNVWINSGPQCKTVANSNWGCTSHLYHWNGRSWQKTSIGDFVSGIAAAPSGAVLAVGNAPRDMQGNGPVSVFRWSGTRWKAISMPHPKAAYAPQIAMSSTSDIWVSDVGAVPADDSVLHWNGSKWTTINSYGGLNSTPKVAADGAGGVWLGDWDHYTVGKWVYVLTGLDAGFGAIQSTELTRVPGAPGTYVASAYIGQNQNSYHPAVIIYGPQP